MDVSIDNKEIMAEIEKNVNRCQVIIENFSNLYQVNTDTKSMQLKKMIDESLVLAKSESREVRKSIKYENDTESLLLNVPLIFVVQILFNLTVNSSQAMRQASKSGELNFTISKNDSQVMIDIQDTGPGIPDDKVSQLFKPFFTTKSQGTGLGLVLSRNLAVKMGGNLEYLGNNSGQGTHFRLTLPLS
jgi:C4-dicarboxylate-specific signal transduction histidine kinase